MTLHTVLGQPALFRFAGGNDDFPSWSEREKRLLVGALNFHALMAPGRSLQAHLYGGSWETLPRTTDDSTFTGMSRNFRSRFASVRIESLVSAEKREPTAGEAPSIEMIRRPQRHLHVSRDDVLAYDPPRDIAPDPMRKVLRAVRASMPLIYDEARDIELLRHRRSITQPAPRRTYEEEFLPGGIHEEYEIVPVAAAPDGAPRAVLFGLHWFELGGAERWAFESVRLARDAGLLPIVLTSRDSHQPWLGRPELDGALTIPFSEATSKSQTSGVEELLRAILRTFDIRGVVVHHNQWLYDRLHWIRRSRPTVPIVDSTHIVEYRGGGYPVSSALVEDAITAHHVISPSLARWMRDVQKIPQRKIVMAPLVGLTVEERTREYHEREAGEPLTVAFVGRMARQKAPEVFVSMAHRLRDRSNIRFVMHGDGDMAGWVDDVIASQGMTDRIERRDSSVAVTATLEEAHLLVVPSHNEGLTLTTFEAVAHGLPVVSTDVGAQRDIVPARALVPRGPHVAVARLAQKVRWIAENETERRRLWHDELEAERKLLSHRSASKWFAEEVAGW